MDNQPVNLFSGTISTLSRSLDLRARKHEMTLKNVANADTPNFKPFKINVEEALQSDLQTMPTSTLQRTDDQHLNGLQMVDDPYTGMESESSSDDPLLLRGDHNGVDIDAEMTALAKNSLLFKVSSQIISNKFSDMKKAITGGTR